MILAAELFGHEFPSGGVGLLVIVGMAFFLLMSRATGGAVLGGGAGGGRTVGRGRMYRCERCGRDFQYERVELLDNGQTRQWIDERCPNCGWDNDWDTPEDRRRRGGSSGTW